MSFIGKGIATALLLVLFLFLGPAGYTDTLVSVSDLHYHSDFEKQVFRDILENNKNDFLAQKG